MLRLRIAEAAGVMRGQVISGNAEALFQGATLDSRRVQGDELFFALSGEQTDGHHQ